MSDNVFAHLTDRATVRRIAVTLAALAVYRIGAAIPLPGIDVGAHIPGLGSSAAIERVSLMSLGVGPWLMALLIAEFAMTAVPRWRRWAKANAAAVSGWIAFAGLALAAVQANGLAVAMEHVAALVPSPGLTYRAGVVVSLVAATAVLIWLAGLVTRRGLGSGLLLMLATPYLVELPSRLSAVAEFAPSAAVLSVALAAIAAALLATAARTEPDLVETGQLFWPPLLAFAATYSLLPTLLFLVAPQHVTAIYDRVAGGDALFDVALAAALTALFYLWRARSLGSDNGTKSGAMRWIVPAMLAGIVAAFGILPALLSTPLALNSRSVIIIVAFALSLWSSLVPRFGPQIQRAP